MGEIVILTGAGLSAESGLGTFRDAEGLWSAYDLNEVATPEGFANNPARVHEFYNARRHTCIQAAPNAAHVALAHLENSIGEDLLIVTQNVDDLHERAGSHRVIHMHGSLMRALCNSCGQTWDAPAIMSPCDACPACQKPATRPDVVWFGEIPYQMDGILATLTQATLFVAIGTSGSVWPAAGFAGQARAAGARALELNLEKSEISGDFDETRQGPATTLVTDWVKEILSSN